MREEMSKLPSLVPTASAVGPCPTKVKLVGSPGTGTLPSTIAHTSTPAVQAQEQEDKQRPPDISSMLEEGPTNHLPRLHRPG